MKAWGALVLIIGLPVLWALIAAQGWKVTETRLGEQIVENQDDILPSEINPYFTITQETHLQARPFVNSESLLPLHKQTTLYAYARRGDWLRVRTIHVYNAPKQVEVLGWVEEKYTRPATGEERFRLTLWPNLRRAFSNQRWFLFFAEVFLAVASLKVFRRGSKIIGIFIAATFFLVMLYDFMSVTHQQFTSYRIHDYEFFNLQMFRVVLVLLCSALTDSITVASADLVMGRVKYTSPYLLRKAAFYSLSVVVMLLVLSMAITMKRNASIEILQVQDPHPAKPGDWSNILHINTTKWVFLIILAMVVSKGIIDGIRNGDRMKDVVLRCFFYYAFPLFAVFFSCFLILNMIGFSIATAALVSSICWLSIAILWLFIGWNIPRETWQHPRDYY